MDSFITTVVGLIGLLMCVLSLFFAFGAGVEAERKSPSTKRGNCRAETAVGIAFFFMSLAVLLLLVRS